MLYVQDCRQVHKKGMLARRKGGQAQQARSESLACRLDPKKKKSLARNRPVVDFGRLAQTQPTTDP